jgi:DNA-binding PadR family transcriptional regulator
MRSDCYGPPEWAWFTRGWGGRGPGHHRGRAFWAEAFAGPTPRAERGEIRFVVLDAISDRPRHGYEIIQHIEQRTSGSYRPSPGVIYPTLQMLEELGHAAVREEEGRKVYGITDAGKQELEQNRPLVDEFYERFKEDSWESYTDDFGELMRSLTKFAKLFRHGFRHGHMSPSTVRAIRRIIEEALGRIEQTLHHRDR